MKSAVTVTQASLVPEELAHQIPALFSPSSLSTQVSALLVITVRLRTRCRFHVVKAATKMSQARMTLHANHVLQATTAMRRACPMALPLSVNLAFSVQEESGTQNPLLVLKAISVQKGQIEKCHVQAVLMRQE